MSDDDTMSNINISVIEERINLLALGNQEVGKTTFILRFTENTFKQIYLSTCGMDMQIKYITLADNKNYKIFFYDTAGEERFKSITFNVLKNADGIILMYDITNRKSFESIAGWMENINDKKGNNFPIVLVGNKYDLSEKRVISKKEGENLANKYKLNFFETSNKTGKNIEESCLKLINIILEKQEFKKGKDMKSHKLSKSVKINNKNNNCQC